MFNVLLVNTPKHTDKNIVESFDRDKFDYAMSYFATLLKASTSADGYLLPHVEMIMLVDTESQRELLTYDRK